MKLKTYLATYLLFLFILFICLGIVSAYLTNTQINMSVEKCESEYQTVSHTLTKDITILMDSSSNFSQGVAAITESYADYYNKNNVDIILTDISQSPKANGGSADARLSFIDDGGKRFICITGLLPVPYGNYRLDYYYDLSENISNLRSINVILLIIFIVFSIITALILYIILSGIFYPLGVVSKASKEIAGGSYGERINVKGADEITGMAENFNLMARRIENQIRALEDEAADKQRFIDNFAHEIRTPLTAVYGYAEYIQRALLDGDEIIELTQSIMDRTDHMKDISSSLLQLATLKNYVPVKTAIPLKQLFEDISWTLYRCASEHNIEIKYNDSGLALTAQEDLIKSMLLNLCFNAIKACPEHGGVIRLEASESTDGGSDSFITLSVTDNGFGIPAESIAKVTEPFYRVDKARSREQGGAGLGLTLCGQIAKAHGAVMGIESEEGKSTSVKIKFTSP